jgi:hypothetical protein
MIPRALRFVLGAGGFVGMRAGPIPKLFSPARPAFEESS